MFIRIPADHNTGFQDVFEFVVFLDARLVLLEDPLEKELDHMCRPVRVFLEVDGPFGIFGLQDPVRHPFCDVTHDRVQEGISSVKYVRKICDVLPRASVQYRAVVDRASKEPPCHLFHPVEYLARCKRGCGKGILSHNVSSKTGHDPLFLFPCRDRAALMRLRCFVHDREHLSVLFVFIHVRHIRGRPHEKVREFPKKDP